MVTGLGGFACFPRSKQVLFEMLLFYRPYPSIASKGSGSLAGLRSHEQQGSADALTCVGDLENPPVGAEVTLKAGSQIPSLIPVCFDIV